jgi:hypothetical protein
MAHAVPQIRLACLLRAESFHFGQYRLGIGHIRYFAPTVFYVSYPPFFCFCDCLSSVYFNAPSGLAIRSSSSMPQPPLCELAGIEKARTMTGF